MNTGKNIFRTAIAVMFFALIGFIIGVIRQNSNFGSHNYNIWLILGCILLVYFCAFVAAVVPQPYDGKRILGFFYISVSLPFCFIVSMFLIWGTIDIASFIASRFMAIHIVAYSGLIFITGVSLLFVKAWAKKMAKLLIVFFIPFYALMIFYAYIIKTNGHIKYILVIYTIIATIYFLIAKCRKWLMNRGRT